MFLIKKSSATKTNTSSNNNDNTSISNVKTANISTTSNPHTGDNIINYCIVLIISFAGLTYTGFVLKKRKNL